VLTVIGPSLLTSAFKSIKNCIQILLMLHSALVRSKLQYVSVAWGSVTVTNPSKLDPIQRKFAALCHSRFFQDIQDYYDNLLGKLNRFQRALTMVCDNQD
jgi:hypothetical protein